MWHEQNRCMWHQNIRRMWREQSNRKWREQNRQMWCEQNKLMWREKNSRMWREQSSRKWREQNRRMWREQNRRIWCEQSRWMWGEQSSRVWRNVFKVTSRQRLPWISQHTTFNLYYVVASSQWNCGGKIHEHLDQASYFIKKSLKYLDINIYKAFYKGLTNNYKDIKIEIQITIFSAYFVIYRKPWA